jgi:beta-glucosidase
LRETTPIRGARSALASVICACAAAASGIALADSGTPTADPQAWPALASPLPPDARLEARARDLLARMSVEAKVGQLIQGDIGSLTPEDVRKYRLGSVLAGGNSDPGGKYNATPQSWLALADAFHAASMDEGGGQVAIPVLFGVDAVHGHSNIVGATLFPHNIGLGAARDPELIRRIGEATAAELRVTGPEWTFAPTVAVPRDDRWGRTYEGYAEDPHVVADYAAAMVEGLQGKVGSDGFLGDTRVLATAKHFIGDGGTQGGKDQGDTQVDERTLREVHGAGYVAALQAGVQSVMASFSSWNGHKLHGHRPLLTDVLKGRLGFDGFVVGDWNGHAQVPGCTPTDCVPSFLAGLDMAMAPDSWRGLYDSTLQAVRSGRLPMARLDDAVLRILRVKLRMGLFEAPKPSRRALGGRFELLGSAAHRALARQAVRESLVLLKNSRGMLPLSPKSDVLVAGAGADSVAMQAGGWTLTWQGTGTTPADFPGAQSIWSGFREQIEAAGGRATLSPDGAYKRKPDVAVVVFGEDPYAEFQGDLADLSYRPGDDADLSLLRRLKADGIPVVAVFLSGRPLWVNRELNASDAFVAAWLPGSEGGGVADVLLRRPDGTVAYEVRGQLPFSWPRTAVQPPQNLGQAGYDPLFPFGYGLRYGQPGELPALAEVSGVSGGGSVGRAVFARGSLANGWSWRLRGADGAESEVPGREGASRDGAVRISSVDRDAQEDARRIQWNADGAAVLVPSQPLDLAREANGDVMLVITLRNDGTSASGAAISAECGAACAPPVPVADDLAALPKGQWSTFGIALKCFARGGALTGVTALRMHGGSGMDVRISRIAFGTAADRVRSCGAPPGG